MLLNDEDEKKEVEDNKVDEDSSNQGLIDEVKDYDILDDDKKASQVESTDSTPSNTDVPSRKQSRADDSKFAGYRKELKRLREENARYKSEIESYGKQSREAITDDTLSKLGFKRDDLIDNKKLKIAQNYTKAIALGEENPEAYAYRKALDDDYQAEEVKKQEALKEEEEKKIIDEDRKKFIEEFGIDELNKAVDSNGKFAKIFGQFVTPGKLTEIYKSYKENFPDEEKDIKEQAKKTGVVPKYSGKSASNLSKDDYKNGTMSDEQAKAYAKAHGYEY